MAGVKLSADEINVAVETIFRETGIENKKSITLEDFQYVMLKEHRDSFAKAQLSLPGKIQPNFTNAKISSRSIRFTKKPVSLC